LFYPGQSSYEWLTSRAHEGAANRVKRGDACTSCHDEQDAEKELGEKLVQAGPLEPMPVKGKEGYKDLKVQAAYDSKNVYLRFQWHTQNAYAGTEHQYLRFDGKAWKVWGFPKLDKIVQDRHMQGIYEDRMSVMIDDGKVPSFDKQGCWLTCHDGERDMPKQFTKEEIAANALMKAIKRNDLRKYVPERLSRPDPVAGAPQLSGGHGRRRLRARMAEFRRRCEHVRRQLRRQDPRTEVHVGREEGRLQVDHRRRSAPGRPLPD
jgi:hypothetical protein